MPIFVDPDELQSNRLWPKEIDASPCEGLEALTGADCVIGSPKLPAAVSPVKALVSHIKFRSLFFNRKSGYDAIGNFDQVWHEIGRMKDCNIPMQQCFILPIGIFKPNKDGLLRIEGKRPLKNNASIEYLTYLKNEAEWGYSGVQVRRLNDESELALFIQAQIEELERIDVLQFSTCAEFFFTFQPYRHVGVTTEGAFLHIAVTDLQISHQ